MARRFEGVLGQERTGRGEIPVAGVRYAPGGGRGRMAAARELPDCSRVKQSGRLRPKGPGRPSRLHVST